MTRSDVPRSDRSPSAAPRPESPRGAGPGGVEPPWRADPRLAQALGSIRDYRPRRWLPLLLFALTFFTTTTLGAGRDLATRPDVPRVPAAV